MYAFYMHHPASSICMSMSSSLPLWDLRWLAHNITWYLDRNWSGRPRPYLWLARLPDGMTRSFSFLSVPWGMSKYRFSWYWHWWWKVWWLRLKAGNGGEEFWLRWRLATHVFSCVSGVDDLHQWPWQEGAATHVDIIIGGASRVRSHNFQGESPRSCHHCQCLELALLKTMFKELRPSPWRKL
jgi:hypothetical protein